MNKLADMIAKGEITVQELANASELIERAAFVTKAVKACNETIYFPFGKDEIAVYHYMDHAGEYEAWGTCTRDGIFACSCNWGGNHQIGKCDLTNFKSVFMALEEDEFAYDLRRFLLQQIEKAENA